MVDTIIEDFDQYGEIQAGLLPDEIQEDFDVKPFKEPLREPIIQAKDTDTHISAFIPTDPKLIRDFKEQEATAIFNEGSWDVIKASAIDTFIDTSLITLWDKDTSEDYNKLFGMVKVAAKENGIDFDYESVADLPQGTETLLDVVAMFPKEYIGSTLQQAMNKSRNVKFARGIRERRRITSKNTILSVGTGLVTSIVADPINLFALVPFVGGPIVAFAKGLKVTGQVVNQANKLKETNKVVRRLGGLAPKKLGTKSKYVAGSLGYGIAETIQQYGIVVDAKVARGVSEKEANKEAAFIAIASIIVPLGLGGAILGSKGIYKSMQRENLRSQTKGAKGYQAFFNGQATARALNSLDTFGFNKNSNDADIKTFFQNLGRLTDDEQGLFTTKLKEMKVSPDNQKLIDDFRAEGKASYHKNKLAVEKYKQGKTSYTAKGDDVSIAFNTVNVRSIKLPGMNVKGDVNKSSRTPLQSATDTIRDDMKLKVSNEVKLRLDKFKLDNKSKLTNNQFKKAIAKQEKKLTEDVSREFNTLRSKDIKTVQTTKIIKDNINSDVMDRPYAIHTDSEGNVYTTFSNDGKLYTSKGTVSDEVYSIASVSPYNKEMLDTYTANHVNDNFFSFYNKGKSKVIPPNADNIPKVINDVPEDIDLDVDVEYDKLGLGNEDDFLNGEATLVNEAKKQRDNYIKVNDLLNKGNDKGGCSV